MGPMLQGRTPRCSQDRILVSHKCKPGRGKRRQDRRLCSSSHRKLLLSMSIQDLRIPCSIRARKLLRHRYIMLMGRQIRDRMTSFHQRCMSLARKCSEDRFLQRTLYSVRVRMSPQYIRREGPTRPRLYIL